LRSHNSAGGGERGRKSQPSEVRDGKRTTLHRAVDQSHGDELRGRGNVTNLTSIDLNKRESWSKKEDSEGETMEGRKGKIFNHLRKKGPKGERNDRFCAVFREKEERDGATALEEGRKELTDNRRHMEREMEGWEK